MPRRIEFSLGQIDQAIQQVKAYKSEIDHKTELLKEKIAQRIERGVRQGFSGAIVDDIKGQGPRQAQVSVFVQSNGTITSVIAQGQDAIWVEFGAGVHHNTPVGTSPNPLGQELGFTIGSYGKGLGKYEYWRFKDDDGNVVKTYGTPAAMPMFRAFQSVLADIPSIAKEVFGS